MSTYKDEQQSTLREYMELLQRNGFVVYEPLGGYRGTYFLYSRVVDGVECFGSVQCDEFGGYSHSMPIKPSREHGSGMFVGDKDSEQLTVDKAMQVASPNNWNRLVGKQANYKDTRWIERSYTRHEPTGKGVATAPRQRKFDYLYVTQGYYGAGWEDVTASDTRAGGKQDLKDYRDNEPGTAHRLITRRVPRIV